MTAPGDGARVGFDPEELGAGAFYRVMTSVILPRPIAWVSTLSADGVPNLAPHSFFTVACVDPPVVQFTSVGRKDSQRNIEETGEFVVNFTPEWLLEAVNESATDFPPDVDEFQAVGLKTERSARVRPPRVAQSPVAIECAAHGSLSLGGGTTVMFGRVLLVAVDADAMGEALPDADRLRPLGRLGANQWSRPGEIVAVDRIPYPAWSAGARSRVIEEPSAAPDPEPR